MKEIGVRIDASNDIAYNDSIIQRVLGDIDETRRHNKIVVLNNYILIQTIKKMFRSSALAL